MKKARKAIRIILSTLLTLIVIIALVLVIGKLVNASKYKIRSDNGVQETEYVTLGGIQQYVQIRGADRENPVIIVLHGGPGSNMAYYSYYWQTPLEEDYTVVHWDQRGCGNTYYRNQGQAESPMLDLLISDLDELVDYCRAAFGQEQIIILGHSWGTVLGGLYAQENPDKVSQYIAVGQMVSVWEGETLAKEEAVRLATAAGDEELVQKMETQYQALRSAQNFDLQALFTFRSLTGQYLPDGENMSTPQQLIMGGLSPYMTWRDFKWFMLSYIDLNAVNTSNANLLDALFLDDGLSMYDYDLQYEMPVTIISGDSDWVTPYILQEAYLNDLSAADKEMLYIQNAGHTPFLDQPEAFMDALLGALQNQS